MSAAEVAVAIGPALAMVARQMMLSRVAGLVTTNIALTNEVLTMMRHGQRAELTALAGRIRTRHPSG